MALIVGCLGVAVGGTCRGIVALSLAKRVIFVAHVGILTLGIVGSIDCTAKLNGSSIARNFWWWRCFIVGIGTSDHNLEAISPLSFVGSLLS